MRYTAIALLLSSGCTTTVDDQDGDTNNPSTDAELDADTEGDTNGPDINDQDTEVQPDCSLNAGRCAPDFVLPNESDAEFALSDLEGSRVLVMGNAMWCPPCNNLAEDVNEWASSPQAPSDLEVVIVIVEDSGFNLPDASDVAAFKSGLDITVNVVADDSGEWIENWGNTRYSYTTIDSQGTVHWHTTGYQSLSTLTTQILAIP